MKKKCTACKVSWEASELSTREWIAPDGLPISRTLCPRCRRREERPDKSAALSAIAKDLAAANNLRIFEEEQCRRLVTNCMDICESLEAYYGRGTSFSMYWATDHNDLVISLHVDSDTLHRIEDFELRTDAMMRRYGRVWFYPGASRREIETKLREEIIHLRRTAREAETPDPEGGHEE